MGDQRVLELLQIPTTSSKPKFYAIEPQLPPGPCKGTAGRDRVCELRTPFFDPARAPLSPRRPVVVCGRDRGVWVRASARAQGDRDGVFAGQ